MSSSITAYARSWRERLLHACLFEILAIGLSTPLAMWFTGRGISTMGVVTVFVAVLALLWNMIYNWIFDQCQARMGFSRTTPVRIVHACLFEVGLVSIALPFIAWWMDVTLLHALAVNVGLVLFYLPYVFFFNLAYDAIRLRIVGRTRAAQPSASNV